MNTRIAKRISNRCANDLTFRPDANELDLVSEHCLYEPANSPLSQWFGRQLLHRLMGDNSTDADVEVINARYLNACGVVVETPDDIELNF